MWLKRVGLFLLTNILIMVTVSVITSVLGFNRYLTPYGINYTSLMGFCFIWGMVGAFISLLLSKMMAKWMMSISIIDPRTASSSERDLLARVQRFAQAAHIPNPEVGIYESPELNAFATGPSKSNSLVAVSTGLLNHMDTTELDGVLAHEISHIANGDMVTMTLIQGVVNAFVMFFSRVIAFAIGQMVRDDDMKHMVRFISTIVLDILFSILGSMVVAYFSRAREFRADEGGAKLAGKHSMIAALQSLQRYMGQPEEERGAALATMKISSSKKASLFSTHPSLEERIAALRGA
jgi:heat shock protein HtpX